MHVPSQISYTSLVEDFMRSLGNQLFPEDQNKRDSLCTVMNEAFTNIVKHSQTASIDGLVRFQLHIRAKDLRVSIFDRGPGIMVENQYPPYAAHLIGKNIRFRQVIDGAVWLQIKNTHQVEFAFEKNTTHADPTLTMEHLKGHGLGLSIMTKIMDSVIYAMRGNDHFDWIMVKKLD